MIATFRYTLPSGEVVELTASAIAQNLPMLQAGLSPASARRIHVPGSAVAVVCTEAEYTAELALQRERFERFSQGGTSLRDAPTAAKPVNDERSSGVQAELRALKGRARADRQRRTEARAYLQRNGFQFSSQAVNYYLACGHVSTIAE
ncbi:MAG: hypothetical protein ABW061_11725 [Polyangiaceae bacterium]